jgi:transposase, IS5 family
MPQQTLAMAKGFERYSKPTRRAEFLATMEQMVPWAELCALIEPHYPKPGNGRPPVGLERMLRIHFLQHWFSLSDPGVEEALYDSLAMRGFVGIDLGREPVPDETTACKFRHLLEQHGLGEQIFARVNQYLSEHGLKIGTGTIVDATILHAPSSTRNATGERDPEMHQVRKGNQWYFGMKAHVGVDHRTKLIHSLATSAAHVADKHMLPDLLHGRETRVWGDQAYQGQAVVLRQLAPRARDLTSRRWRSKLQMWPEERERNRIKAKTRSRVEHVFAVLKLKFRFTKVCYRGLKKNTNRLFAACALVNLFTARKRLLASIAA